MLMREERGPLNESFPSSAISDMMGFARGINRERSESFWRDND